MDKEQAIELLEHLAWDKDNEGNCCGEALRMAIDAVDAIGHIATMSDGDKCIRRRAVKYTLSMLPTSQPVATDTNVGDTISRQAVIDVIEDYPHGVWNVENMEDMVDKIKALTSVQPEECTEKRTKTHACDLISRQAAIDAIAEQMPTPYTPDGSHPADEQIFQVQEVYVDCITTIKLLPTIQPEPPIIKCKDCKWWRKQKDSAQGRCRLLGIYPTGAWYCGNAERRTE